MFIITEKASTLVSLVNSTATRQGCADAEKRSSREGAPQTQGDTEAVSNACIEGNMASQVLPILKRLMKVIAYAKSIIQAASLQSSDEFLQKLNKAPRQLLKTRANATTLRELKPF